MSKLTDKEIREKMVELCPEWEKTVEECLDEGNMELIAMIVDNEVRFMAMIIEDSENLDQLEKDVSRGIKMETFYNQLIEQFPLAHTV